MQSYGAILKASVPSETMMKEGHIVVYQDVRGRWYERLPKDNMRAL
jgi:hypothetical protein